MKIETQPPFTISRRFEGGLIKEFPNYRMFSVSLIELSVPWINGLKFERLQLVDVADWHPLFQRTSTDFSISVYKAFH